MALNKKLADTISLRVNGLLVYKTMADNASSKKDYDGMLRAMQWFNGEADTLIDMGINVIKYKDV
jgi:hypothetical protein